MSIRRKVTTTSSITEEYADDTPPQTTTDNAKDNGTNYENTERKIETGQQLLNSFNGDIPETASVKNEKTPTIGRTNADLIADSLEKPHIITPIVIMLCYGILPKKFSVSGILYPLVVGLIISGVGFIVKKLNLKK
jgi:hypothetical protein